MSRKEQFICLLVFLGLILTLTPSDFAQSQNGPLNFGNNYFVTGDYVVAGAQEMSEDFANGYAVGTIEIPDGNPGITGARFVPPGAEVVAAVLYWQTVEKVGIVPGQPGSGENGYFRPVFHGGPNAPGYPITGVNLGSGNAVAFSNGGCVGTSTGKLVRTYRANVLGALPRDSTGNIAANGQYEVRLPSVGNNTPLTLGATLVLIYRILAPGVPLNSIVIYDGAYAPGTGALTMKQTIQGFYDAAHNPVSRLTHIVGNGKGNKFETVYLGSGAKNVQLPSLYPHGAPPFPGYYGNWDNPTWTFSGNANPMVEDAASATTEVIPASSNQGCVSWGAVIVSTTVKNSDSDGLLDVWKKPIPPNNPTRPGYCDGSVKEGACTQGDANWVDLPGAVPGHKDVFVQLDYMCSSPTGPDACTNAGDGTNYSFDPRLSGAIDMVVGVNDVGGPFINRGIHVHVNPTGTNQPNIHAIQETTCVDNASPLQLCTFPGQPGVVAWKGGFDFLKNQLVDKDGTSPAEIVNDCATSPPVPGEDCIPRFQPGKRTSWHYVLFAHAVGQPKWKLQDNSLVSVKQSGNTVTLTTSTALGTLNVINGHADPTCANGRVTIFGAGTNPNLDGTFCVTSAGVSSFTITIGGSSTNASYTYSTDPNLAVAPGFTSSASGVSDVGGADSLVTLGLWGNPAFNGAHANTTPVSDGQSKPTMAGTFMHEFGHSAGLTHGGFTYPFLQFGIYVSALGPNCGPNFQSVMNYQFQVDLLAPQNGGSRVPDYSGQVLADLNKKNPGVANVFKNLAPVYLNTSWYVPYIGVGNAVSVHCDGTPKNPEASLSLLPGLTSTLSWAAGQDINFDGSFSETLHGYNDWLNLDLRQIGATGTNSTAEAGGQAFGGGGQAFGGGGQAFGGGGQSFGGGGQALGGGGQALGGGGQAFGGGGQAFGGGGEVDVATINSYTRPPQNLMASEAASPRKITLSWAAPTFGQIGAYNVYRSVIGGNLTEIAPAVSGNPPTTTYTDTVTCKSTGYAYFVTAVLANPLQESVGSNTVTTGINGPVLGQGKLTGCYTVTGFSSPTSGTQGSIVPITWTLQDDYNTTGTAVNNFAANTLVAIGPGGTRTTLVSNGVPTAQAAGTLVVSAGQFTFSWDSDPYLAGSYTFELDLDSGQILTTASPLVLAIDVNDTDTTPHVTTVYLPDGVVESFYNTQLTQHGGTPQLTWTLASGTPPVGISVSPAGVVSGTTCAAGPYNFTVNVTDLNSKNSGTQVLSLNIRKADTTTSVAPNANPSVFGQTVAFTATVAPNSACTPTGTVTFKDGAVALAGSSPVNPASLSSGTASYTTTATQLAAGPHAITAVYSGDANFNAFGVGSSSATPLFQMVQKASPAFSFISSQTIIYGDSSATFTGTLSANCGVGCSTVYPPNGESVSIAIGAASGSGTIVGANGAFSVTVMGTEALGVSSSPYTIQYSYTGDSNFKVASDTSTKLTVHQADTATSVLISTNSPTLGDPVTLTATVVDATANSTGSPTGLVTFFVNGAPIGTGPLVVGNNGDQAAFTTSLLAAGPNSITAAYDGDANFYATGGNGGESMFTGGPATPTVALRATQAVTVGLAPDSVNVGQGSTATVTVTDNGTTNPTGTADSWVVTTGTPGTGTTGSTATLFSDGMVLVAGGTNSGATVVPNAYVYSATSNTFVTTGSLNMARTAATATLLPNGGVLVAGGSTDGTPTNALNTAELYNPVTGTFTVAGSGSSNQMTAARFGATATLLGNGQVLIVGGQTSGGSLATAELYNPVTDTFTATSSMHQSRYGAAATLLSSGNVLIAGGHNGAVLTEAELYDPIGGAFSVTSSLGAARMGATATVLLSGNVLIAGGSSDGTTTNALNSAELYNPTTPAFTASNSLLNTARFKGTATLLPNGMVLLVGGTSGQTAELYDPDSDVFDATGTLMTADQASLTATLLNNDHVLITGLTSGGGSVADAELYTPSFDPLGTVALSSSDTSDSPDVFTPAPSCVLTTSGSGVSTCTSTVTPGEVGSSPHTITGTYPADSVHSGNSGSGALTVTSQP